MRILDFTRVLAGPLSTALLADLGAEVVKIEPPQGDDYRAIGPMNNGESALFTVMNRNKQSLVLDLKHPEAVALVHEMAAQADVVVENFRPGVAERLGIGASQLRALNPRLVYVSVSGFGQTGPLAHRPAYDIIVQAMSGLMEATGEPMARPPSWARPSATWWPACSPPGPRWPRCCRPAPPGRASRWTWPCSTPR